jgi:hypothetical protein
VYAAAADATHILRADPGGRKVVLTVFSAPPHSRLIRETSLRFRASFSFLRGACVDVLPMGTPPA